MSGSDFDLTGSRLQNATRVNQAAEDADVTDWPKANDFIICAMVEALGHGGGDAILQLRWRNVTDSGSFTDLTGVGELTFSATTDLVNNAAVSSGEEVCTPVSGTTLVDGVEKEGGSATTTTINQNEYTEHQFAVRASGGLDSKQYEFEIYDVSDGAPVGTCLAQITTAAGAVTRDFAATSISPSAASVGLVAIRVLSVTSLSPSAVAAALAVARPFIAASLSEGAVAVSLNVIALENFVGFGGTNEWLGPKDTSSLSDSQSFLAGGWIKPNSAGYIAQINGARFVIRLMPGAGGNFDIRITAENAAGTPILIQQTDNLVINGQANHFLFNVDLGAAVLQGYINKTAVTFDGGGTLDDDTIDFTNTTGLAIGAQATGGGKIDAALQEMAIYFGQNLDISQESNRDKFIDADGIPVFLGIGGELPTGTDADVLLRDPYSSFGTNSGTLGDFTENGTLFDEGTKPALLVPTSFATVVGSESAVAAAIVENKVLAAISSSPSAGAAALVINKVLAASMSSESAASVVLDITRAFAASSLSESAAAVALTVTAGGATKTFVVVSASTSDIAAAVAVARAIIASSTSESLGAAALAANRPFAAASLSSSIIDVAPTYLRSFVGSSVSSSAASAAMKVTRALSLASISNSTIASNIVRTVSFEAASLSQSIIDVALEVVAGVTTFALASISPSTMAATLVRTVGFEAASLSSSLSEATLVRQVSFGAASLSESAMSAALSGFWFKETPAAGAWTPESEVGGSWTPEDPEGGSWTEEDPL